METILVIEDEANIARALKTKLSHQGFNVHSVLSGSLALAWLRENANALPDLIILDMLMPDMDGFQVLQTLRAEPHWKNLSVLVLSVLGDDDRVRALGVEAFLTKPYKGETLVKTVREIFSRKRGGPDGNPQNSGR